MDIMTMKQKKNKVAIIILAWNQVHYTKICIDSIKKFTDRNKYDLIVVDQGSEDGTLKYLDEVLTGERDLIVRNRRNRGFSGGNNQALKLAECEYILFLNNDCKIKGYNWLPILMQASKEENVGLVGTMCHKAAPDYAEETVNHVGSSKIEEDWSYVEGWCLFGKWKLFQELKGFDMQFNPAYGEDADLSYRVKELGLKLKTVKLPIKHYGSKSKKQLDHTAPEQNNTSRHRMFSKWVTGKRPIESKIEADKPTILFRRKGAMGDVLLTTPILFALKNKYPNSYIVYETDCPGILTGNPCINEIVRREPKLKKYDIVLTPRYEVDMEKNAIITMANQCNVTLKKAKLQVYLTEDDVNPIRRFLKPNQRHIVFHTGRAWKSKEWELDRFVKVASHYKKKGYEILEIGNPQTQYTGVGKDCRGLPIKQTAALIKECCLFLGIDSGCAHIAKAVGTPACVIYGCVHPFSPASDAIEYPIRIEDLECGGCRGRTDKEWTDCVKPEVYCLTGITPEMVIDIMTKCILEHIVPEKRIESAEEKRIRQGRHKVPKKQKKLDKPMW